MAYHRFLTNKDYSCIATEEHMRQIIRDVPERIPQAEQRAEMQLLEYLDQYYEIEKLLAIGKNIQEYSSYVSYPGGVFIRKDENIFRTLTSINGYQRPTKKIYWRQIVDFVDPRRIDHIKKYSQLRMYSKGEIAMFGTEYWECLIPHGFEAGEIHMPGVVTWLEAEVTEWEPNMEWKKDQVCVFNEQFYQYLGEENDEEDNEKVPDGDVDDHSDDNNTDSNIDGGDVPSDPEEVLTPEEDDLWGLIGEYSEDLEYDYSEGVRDYVVAEETVFYPVLNPNPDALEEGVNIVRDDPRNANVVAHLSRIALYHLHSIISPTNIPETRRWAYEDSIQWLYNASKFKINPQLPRKREKGSCEPKVDWACATFQREFDPYENPWLI